MKKPSGFKGHARLSAKPIFMRWGVGLLIAASFGTTVAAPKVSTPLLPYSYFVTGNANLPVTVPLPRPTSSLVLMGGGPDVDPAFQWMIKQAGITPQTGGRFVVIRATGTEAYNPYIFYSDANSSTSITGKEDWVDGAFLGLTSVETLVIPSIEAANHTDVNTIVSKANAVFIAGGDQSAYVKFWKGTALERTLNQLMGNNVPIGGTSAGLAVLGNFDYAGLTGSVTSRQALSNPYHKYMTLDPNPLTGAGSFLNPTALNNTILDSHLDARDRMGRLITFAARLVKFNNATSGCPGGLLLAGTNSLDTARGIGISVETALLVEGDAASAKPYMAKMTTNPKPASTPAVYFVQPTIPPGTCASGKDLAMDAVEVRKLANTTDAFNLSSWTGVPVYRRVRTSAGALTSSDAVTGLPVADPY